MNKAIEVKFPQKRTIEIVEGDIEIELLIDTETLWNLAAAVRSGGDESIVVVRLRDETDDNVILKMTNFTLATRDKVDVICR